MCIYGAQLALYIYMCACTNVTNVFMYCTNILEKYIV